MALALVTKEKLTAIANAIRQKLGKSDGYTLDDMPAAILGISGSTGYKYEKITVAGNNGQTLSFPTKGRAVHFYVGINYDGGSISGSTPVVMTYDSDATQAVGLKTAGFSTSIVAISCTKAISDSETRLTIPSGNIFVNGATYDFFYVYE